MRLHTLVLGSTSRASTTGSSAISAATQHRTSDYLHMTVDDHARVGYLELPPGEIEPRIPVSDVVRSLIQSPEIETETDQGFGNPTR